MREKQTTKLRNLLKEGRTLVKPGAYNALSAMIIERAGFKCVGVSGYGVSASLLGKPDVGLITLSEIVQVSGYIARAVNIPVIADADTGFGNAINVMRTVEDFITAGVASIHMEDQVSPKRCGHVAGKQVISLEEAVGKIRAADRVRRELDPDFVLIARCDARGVRGGTVEELIRRSNAYLEAGADMIFPEAIPSEAELERCAREIQGPIHYNRTGTGVSPLVSLERLNEMGIAITSNAGGALFCAAQATWDYMHAFAAEDSAFVRRWLDETENHPFGKFNDFIGFPQIKKFEEEFLAAEEVAAKYEGSLGYQP